jgi:hypothetical protein
MSFYLWIRFLDLAHRNALGLLKQNRIETWLFALEPRSGAAGCEGIRVLRAMPESGI